MKSNFHSNQIVYVRNIGYARLAIPGNNNPKSNQVIKTIENNTYQPYQQTNQQNNDSVLFDPDMFNIDADSPFGQSQVQVHLTEHTVRKPSMQVSRRPSVAQTKSRQLIIVPLKLQQTNAMIYCPQTNLMKKISMRVKSLLQNNRKQILLNIQLTKTIDNLKNLIFKQLGQQIGYYSDIKIYTSAPRLEELNIGSKTVWQYYLKDKCRIMIAAKFNFTFKMLAKQSPYLALSNGNNTINSIFPIFPVVAKKEEPVAIVATIINPTTTASTSTEPPKPPTQNPPVQQPIIQPITQQVKKQQAEVKKPQESSQKQKQKPKPQKLHLQCNSKLRSGIHFWQFKIDKLLNNENSTLMIGICLKSQQQFTTQNYIHLWAYDIIRCKKIEIQTQKAVSKNRIVIPNSQKQKQQQQQNGSEDSDQQYGSVIKAGDVIGVLLTIKQKSASLIFYKNSICLQECYEFNIDRLKLKQHKNQFYLCPFVNLGGEVQLTLDSKAVAPLDSYRFK